MFLNDIIVSMLHNYKVITIDRIETGEKYIFQSLTCLIYNRMNTTRGLKLLFSSGSFYKGENFRVQVRQGVCACL